MKLIGVLRKTMREQLRDFWTLALTLSLAPFFVVMYWMFFGGSSTTYKVLVINQDVGTQIGGATWNAGDKLTDAIDHVTYESGQALLKVRRVTDRAEAEKTLRDRGAALLVVIPENFSRSLTSKETPPAQVDMVGDLTNPYYAVSAEIVNGVMMDYLQSLSSEPSPVQVSEQALGGSAARTEFETWVPPLFMMAAILLIYQTAMTVAHEIEAGTINRLRLTPMTAFDLMGGISISQLLIGVIAVGLTFYTAVILGFHSEGPLWIALLLGAITSFAMIGVGLLVACFSRTVARAFMISNFPLFLMTFFSGVFMPVSNLALFTIGGHTIGLFDLLPPTHAIIALNKVVNLGTGLDGILYELTMLTGLTVIYFSIGVWLFQRMYLRRR